MRATGRPYTDAQTASYENLVKMAAVTALAGREPLNAALQLVMLVRVAPTASTSRKGRELMLAGHIRPAKKPDLDNVLKAVLDGCNKVAFTDDALVVGFSVSKVYAETPGVDVTLEVIA